MKRRLATHVGSVNASDVRVEDFDGDPHVVAPVVAVKEGVLKGMYLPEDEIHAAAPAFNGSPLPIGHPKEGGQFVSANTPERVQTQSVGHFFNVESADANDGVKLLGETWVNARRSAALADVDAIYGAPLAILAQHLDDPGNAGEFIDALPQDAYDYAENAASGMLEVSTAYWFDPEETAGSFNGNEYATVQRHVRPDHLALLPHKEGECSVADGCGAPRANEREERANTANGSVEAQAGDGTDSSMNTDPADAATATDTDTDTDALPNPFTTMANAIGKFAHNCACGCGGACHDSTMEPEKLADLTGISLEILEAMDEEDRKSLADLATLEDDEDDGGEDGNDPDDGQDTNDENGAVAEEIRELRAEMGEVKSEVAEAKELAAAQEREEKNELVDDLEPHSHLDRDTLEDLDKEVLEGMAADILPAQADFGGRVRGVPSANFAEQDDEKLDDAKDLVANLRGGEPATDGGTNDDETQ